MYVLWATKENSSTKVVMLRRRQVSKERFVSFNFRSWASKNFRLHFADQTTNIRG